MIQSNVRVVLFGCTQTLHFLHCVAQSKKELIARAFPLPALQTARRLHDSSTGMEIGTADQRRGSSTDNTSQNDPSGSVRVAKSEIRRVVFKKRPVFGRFQRAMRTC